MSKSKYEITKDGLKKFEEELEYLKTVKRKENIQALQEARAQGDLSENAEYDAARDEQAKIEARISELENIIKNAKIIESDDSDFITADKTVTYKILDSGEIEKFKIVGSQEADPFQGKISINSPVAQALLGHKAQDTVEIFTSSGSYKVQILEVENNKTTD
ncbi:MAG TPA: transcription elongation factor GreA [Haloplasmataceae bacterium]